MTNTRAKKDRDFILEVLTMYKSGKLPEEQAVVSLDSWRIGIERGVELVIREEMREEIASKMLNFTISMLESPTMLNEFREFLLNKHAPNLLKEQSV